MDRCAGRTADSVTICIYSVNFTHKDSFGYLFFLSCSLTPFLSLSSSFGVLMFFSLLEIEFDVQCFIVAVSTCFCAHLRTDLELKQRNV